MTAETTSEQLVWERLAVFAGGGTLEAAEAVCSGEGIAPNAVGDLLAGLVAAGRVVIEPAGAGSDTRYALPESLEERARTALMDRGAAEAAQQRHLAYYLALAERAGPELVRPQAAAWLERLEAEYANFQAALGWARNHCEAESGLRLGDALVRFWYTRGNVQDGRGWLAALLVLPGADAYPVARARALDGAAYLAFRNEDLAWARRLYEESLALGRELDNAMAIRSALQGLGRAALRW